MDILTKEMKDIIAALGELVKNDPRCTAIETCIHDYEHADDLNDLIAAYNVEQNRIADAYHRGETLTDEEKHDIQDRMDTLYDQVNEHPVYTAYLNAKKEFDALTSEIYAELQYVITGQRPCSCGGSCGDSCGPDCSCGGCH